MPTFTIHRDGQEDSAVQLDGDRIELGSANTCQVFIDDLLVALHQAVFIRTESGYDVEPLTKRPPFTMDGQPVASRTRVSPGAAIEVEGYTITVDFQAAQRELSPAVGEPVEPLPIQEPAPAPVPLPIPPAPARPSSPIPTPQPLPSSQLVSVPSGNELPPVPPPLNLDELKTPVPKPPSEPPPPPPPPPVVAQELPTPPPIRSPVRPPVGDHDEASEETRFVPPPVGQLVVVQGPLLGNSYPLRRGEVKIGRDQEKNDIVIRTDVRGEVDKSISRRHASVICEGSAVFVEDQGSVAGTFVNGQQLAPKQRVTLNPGDQVEIRSAKESSIFRLEVAGHPVPPPPAPVSAPQPRQQAAAVYREEAAPPRPAPPIPPPLTPPPVAPRPAAPPPQQWSGPQYDRPAPAPAPAPEPEGERPRARRRRQRGADSGANPFEQVGGGNRLSDVPVWVWFVIALAIIAVILMIIFLIP